MLLMFINGNISTACFTKFLSPLLPLTPTLDFTVEGSIKYKSFNYLNFIDDLI